MTGAAGSGSDTRVGATPADTPGPPRALVVAVVVVAVVMTAWSLARYAGVVRTAPPQADVAVGGGLRISGEAVAPP